MRHPTTLYPLAARAEQWMKAMGWLKSEYHYPQVGQRFATASMETSEVLRWEESPVPVLGPGGFDSDKQQPFTLRTWA